jgi:SAM-dependent methyltransferase
LSRSLSAGDFIKLTLSNYRGTGEHLQKLTVRPIDTKTGPRLLFQTRYDTRDVAKNYETSEAIDELLPLITSGFRNSHLFTATNDFQLTVGKRNARLISGKPSLISPTNLRHDRIKKTLVDPNATYLKALGITTDKGEIRASQRDKWRQINKYVEILASLFDKSTLHDKRDLRIVDMGSGKGYLTFAAYDHLANTRGSKVEMIGVELRKDLVSFCNDVAAACDFDGLRFEQSDIESFDSGEVDVLIALHACDTATDDAIFKGITHKASIIIASPCCHKEIRRQMKPPEVLRDILRHGTMLEREAETITDGLRSMLLERSGYTTKVFEFVPTSHTPKNNMIAATFGSRPPFANDIQERIDAVKAFYGIAEQRLENLLA